MPTDDGLLRKSFNKKMLHLLIGLVEAVGNHGLQFNRSFDSIRLGFSNRLFAVDILCISCFPTPLR